MKKDKSDLHDLLVETDRVELRKYASYLLEPDHDRTLVLTTHVVAERLLEGMISTVLVYPDAWLREADFRSKVSLARALGLIEQREINICKVLNSARNAIAHTLEPLPEKWRKEMVRLAYGSGSGIRWKKGISKDLNKTLRVLLAIISSRLLQARFQTHLTILRKDHRDRWKSLWVEKMLANMDLFGNPEAEKKLAYEVDLLIATELDEKRNHEDPKKNDDRGFGDNARKGKKVES
jgi:hypothetical protein